LLVVIWKSYNVWIVLSSFGFAALLLVFRESI